MFLSFHSYGEHLLLPYGHTFEQPANYHDMMSIGLKGKAAMATRNGADYYLCSIYSVVDTFSGNSIDWAYDVGKVPLAFAFEFKDSEDGAYGLLLPPEPIIPNCQEFMDGIQAMIAEALALGYFN